MAANLAPWGANLSWAAAPRLPCSTKHPVLARPHRTTLRLPCSTAGGRAHPARVQPPGHGAAGGGLRRQRGAHVRRGGALMVFIVLFIERLIFCDCLFGTSAAWSVCSGKAHGERRRPRCKHAPRLRAPCTLHRTAAADDKNWHQSEPPNTHSWLAPEDSLCYTHRGTHRHARCRLLPPAWCLAC